MTSQHDDSPSGRRQAALAVIAFAAALTLLFGLSRIVDRATAPTTASPSASRAAATIGPSPSARPSASAAGNASPSAGPNGSSSSSASAAPASPSRSPSGDPVLVGAGDIGNCDTTDDTATAALVAEVEGTVFTVGDNAYPDGSAQDYQDCYEPTWGAFKARTRPAPGNHEWRTADLKGYLDYFGTAAAPNGTPWYSYDLGTWHVIVLDSTCDKTGGCGPDSAQGQWLAADLAASDARCTLALWHAPRFSSGSEHGNDEAVAPFWTALYAADADLVVNGHDHDYERFAPQDPEGHEDRARGIREFVVGTGGTELRTFKDPKPNSELRAAVSHGVLKLVLHAESYEWSFLPTTGNLADSGSNRCH